MSHHPTSCSVSPGVQAARYRVGIKQLQGPGGGGHAARLGIGDRLEDVGGGDMKKILGD